MTVDSIATYPPRAGTPPHDSEARRLEVNEAALTAYLPRQRWFGAKDRRLNGVSVIGTVPLGWADRSWLLTIIEASYDRGAPDRYFTPLGPKASLDELSSGPELSAFGRDTQVYDAAGEPAFVHAVLARLTSGTGLPFGTAQIRFSATKAFAFHAPASPNPLVRPLGVEQSNSSAVIEGCGVLKLYRRLQPGVSPEIETTRFLTARGYDGAPPLLGAIELVDARAEPTGLGVLIAWVANRGDAWEGFALDHLRRALQGGPDPDRDLAFFALVETLGRRTAELHRALCPADPVEEAFSPEPITADDLAAWRGHVAAWRGHVRADAEAMFEAVAARSADGKVASSARLLLDTRDALLQRIESLAHGPITALKTRFHGDYHLGQVLFTGDDFRIIDFEGEPRRTIAERRAKHSPLKDVAGMLRSFDYAAAAALREFKGENIGAEARQRARRWRELVVESFLGGYRTMIAGCPSYPADAKAARELLDLLVLEKAIYEVRYELANRPDWLSIPVVGIQEVLGRPSSPTNELERISP